MVQADGHDFTQQGGVDRQIGFFPAQIHQTCFQPPHDELQENRQHSADRQGPQRRVGASGHHTVVNVHGEKYAGQGQHVGHHGCHHGLHIKSTETPKRAPEPIEGRALHGGQRLVIARGRQLQSQYFGACQGLQFRQRNAVIFHALFCPPHNRFFVVEAVQNTSAPIDQRHENRQDVMRNIGKVHTGPSRHKTIFVGHVRVGGQGNASTLIQCKTSTHHLQMNRTPQEFGGHGHAKQQRVRHRVGTLGRLGRGPG